MNAADAERAREISDAFKRGYDYGRTSNDEMMLVERRIGYEEGHKDARRVGRVLLFLAALGGALVTHFLH